MAIPGIPGFIIQGHLFFLEGHPVLTMAHVQHLDLLHPEDLKSAMQQWNVLQATLRSVSSALSKVLRKFPASPSAI